MNIYVGNLSSEVTDNDLENAFNKFGEWLPDVTIKAFNEYLVGIKGPLTTPVGGGSGKRGGRRRAVPGEHMRTQSPFASMCASPRLYSIRMSMILTYGARSLSRLMVYRSRP